MGADNPAAQYVDRRFNTEDLRSDSPYEKARGLIEECRLHHGSCGGWKVPMLPTRVLDMYPDSGVDLKLHEPKSRELGEYIALSYCWGEAQPAQTTKETLNDKLLEIDKSTLPQSIQDAIFVTRKLGHRYLWVDSLCIVQDSEEDKIKEITKMTDIYNKASLTIAASIATKASSGFLQTRSSIPERRKVENLFPGQAEVELFPDIIKLPFPCPNGDTGEVELLLAPPSHHDDLEPLNLRGWTMQERFLSRRLLIFGEHEVTWQCQSILSPEPITKTLWKYKGDSPRLPLELYQIDLPPHLRAPPPPNAVKGQGVQWKLIATEYSRRQLSFIDDRFNAIGGIVQLLQEVWKDEYLAGLWKGNLLYTSLWYITGDVISDDSYLAPSWSWLSINTTVDFWILESIDAEFVDCRIELQNRSLPYGSVTRGELTIHGATYAAVEALKYQIFEWSFKMDDGLESLVKTTGGLHALNKELENQCIFLFIGLTKEGPAGLVLFPVEDGKYRRVGCFEILHCPSWHKGNPFRYTASNHLTSNGKRKWLCQVGRKDVIII